MVPETDGTEAEDEEQPETLGTKVDPDLAEEVELLADAEGVSKGEWLRDVVHDAVQEKADGLTERDLIRAALARQPDEVEVGDDDGGDGIYAYLPGGEKDPGPLGTLNRLRGD